MKGLYSGKQVEKAGIAFRDPDTLLKDSEKFDKLVDVLSYWRSCHEKPLESALKIVESTVLKKDDKAIFAKRLKRYISIVRKLNRFKCMSLKNMQDIGGCRAIISNEEKLRQSVQDLKDLECFKDASGKYRFKDYIKKPKEDGYRSYHLIGRFPDEEGGFRNIEVQLRTRIQHYWATALEIVDLFTDQVLKSNEGDPVWKNFFIQISKQFAIMESVRLFEQFSDEKKLQRYSQKLRRSEEFLNSCSEAKKICQQLNVFEKLNAFSESLKVIDEELAKKPNSGYALLTIDTSKKEVLSMLFPAGQGDAADAAHAYIKAEKEHVKNDGMIVALVSSSAVGGIKEAYPNYFADSSEFIKYLHLVMAIKI